MAKNISKRHEEELEEDFDFAEFMESGGGEAFSDIMNSLLEAGKHQMTISLELTRLVVESTSKEMSEEKVFSTFKQAAKVVSESFPLKELTQKI